jgi:hypothetical protein
VRHRTARAAPKVSTLWLASRAQSLRPMVWACCLRKQFHNRSTGTKTMIQSAHRRLSTVATATLAVFVVIASSVTAKPLADNPHASHMLQCATVCADCQVQCDACSIHCAALVRDGKKEHAKCMSMCVDCAECCKMCASLCARQSDLCAHACDCCIKCCNDCAAACEKFPDDKQMAACAKSCRNCVKECSAMLKKMQ